ncbi:hypothetical protein P4O66_018243 [Electrophorus voltai]|uniref:Uncharacterized protein n=1 Tax=Electrophorus voltai TaxID=2609070 RepID=A0AAD8YQ69_9TELE|nr:hypothetical protein P4O66_018243 [Electrophorus voltai]
MASNVGEMEAFQTEYRLLEVYHDRRKCKSNPGTDIILQGYWANRAPGSGGPARHGQRFLEYSLASLDTDHFEDVADKLTHIVDSVPVTPKEAVPDTDDLTQRLVELLKESGDQLNQKVTTSRRLTNRQQTAFFPYCLLTLDVFLSPVWLTLLQILKDCELSGFLERSFSYSAFESLASAFVRVVAPESRQPEWADKKTQIAWTFEMTSRLGALDLQPTNRIMGYGAQYLHQYFAPWIQQHGGWEKVFNSDESDEEIQ